MSEGDESGRFEPQFDRNLGLDRNIDKLKMNKSRAKATFTRHKNVLLQHLDPSLEDTDPRTVISMIKSTNNKLDLALETAMNSFQELSEYYMYIGNDTGLHQVAKDMEILENEYADTVNQVQEYFRESKSSRSGASEDHLSVDSDNESESLYELPTPRVQESENQLGQDLWKQMKRVSIPMFSGDKTKYDSWKAAFMACIDKAPATKEYKLLQLRQYLSGEALNCIDKLGHSASAYDTALQRLERKFGGHRRQVARYLEELENFYPMKEENARSLEKFADLLDVAVVNISESDGLDDLKNGSLYLRLQKKLPDSMLTRYHRWIHENQESESVLTLRKWILLESEFHTIAEETLHGLSRTRIQKQGKGAKSEPNRTYFVQSEQKGKSKQACKFCNGPHGIWNCKTFQDLRESDRWEKAKELKLCFRCLGHDHVGGSCKRSRVCGIQGCTRTHHRLLHTKPESNQNQTVRSENVPRNGDTAQSLITEGESTLTSHFAPSVTGLRTVPVIVSSDTKKIKINALLDDGSTKSYINSDIAAELGIQTVTQKVKVNVLNGNTETFETMPVSVKLESLNGQCQVDMSVFTADKVTGNLKAVNWSEYKNKWDHLKQIQFPKLSSRPVIDLLIGTDYSDLHYSLRDIKGQPGEPIARLTPLGWTCIGSPEDSHIEGQETHFSTFFSQDREQMNEVNDTLRSFWEIEASGTVSSPIMSKDDRSVLQKTEESLTYSHGRYSVAIPWKESAPKLHDNYQMAVKRLENTEKRLRKNPEVAEMYEQTIEKYVEKGYVQKVTESSPETKWFLPHFPVIRPERDTTKVRIVFDASAKQDGISLNDTMYQGPKLQNDLFDVLLRFRKHPVALVCDIEEMYLQINLKENDKLFHRFLWRTDYSQEPDIYEFNRLVFGANCSPFLAQYVSQENARLYGNEYPLAADTILNSTYMDDSMDSVMNNEQAIKLYHQLSDVWGKAAMYARKWLSNSTEVLNNIPPQDRVKSVNLETGHFPLMKTLGVQWIASEDNFQFKSPDISPKSEISKRIVLKRIASIFDPIGFAAPYVIRGKMLLQEIWISGCDWDEPLETELQSKIRCWLNEMPLLDNLRLPRCLQFTQDVDFSTIQTFVDASTEAYGAVLYIRHVLKSEEVITRFVTAKARVAPLKAISIPRLELTAAVLGLRLTEDVSKTLNIQMSDVTFWSDSMNVLWWVRNHSRNFKPFISNRIGEIQTNSKPEQWRYVPTELNPADYVTRGLTADELLNKDTWLNGPDFLQSSEDQWPENKVEKLQASENEERKIKNYRHVSLVASEVQLVGQNSTHVSDSVNRLDVKRYSDWNHMVRIYAWVYRFIENCKTQSKQLRTSGQLQPEEIRDIEIKLIKSAQGEQFQAEVDAIKSGKEINSKSKLVGLKPFIDNDGLLRCSSRLKYAEHMSYDAKFPVILPRKSYVTKLIVRKYHENGNHSGTNQILASLSAQYWIIAAREEIRDVEHDCAVCRIRKAKPGEQIMAPLPDFRVGTSLRPFTHTAVDFAGPFLTKQGRGKVKTKRYLCLFTCVQTRAVHLEMAYGLDTDSFLNAFYRMVSRRGLPKVMISDNGTNFVGANRELKDLLKGLDRDKIVNSTANQGIKWKFNPPLAPHFGGIHESLIKSAKRAIFCILQSADITDEELLSAFVGAEGLMNSRPLTYQSANPSDEEVLTPNHFLFGQIGGVFAPESVDETVFSPRKRWRRVQELVKHFWKRWLREYIPTLGSRKKWRKTHRNFQVGDIVLVVEPEAHRGHWSLGRITEVFRGPDDNVRVVNVQVGKMILKRAVTRLAFIESCPASD